MRLPTSADPRSTIQARPLVAAAALGALLFAAAPASVLAAIIIGGSANAKLAPFYVNQISGDLRNSSGVDQQGSFYESNLAPRIQNINAGFSTPDGATMSVSGSTVPGGFFLAQNRVDVTINNAQSDTRYYAAAGYGSRTSVEFFSAPDLARTVYTWEVSGVEQLPIGFGGSRLDFTAVRSDSVQDFPFYNLTSPATPLHQPVYRGPGVYTYNLPTELNVRYDLFFWSSAFVQINAGVAEDGANYRLYADYGSTFRLTDISLFDSLDNPISGWTLRDLASNEVFTAANFVSVAPPSSVPEPFSIALLGLGLVGIRLVGRRQSRGDT